MTGRRDSVNHTRRGGWTEQQLLTSGRSSWLTSAFYLLLDIFHIYLDLQLCSNDVTPRWDKDQLVHRASRRSTNTHTGDIDLPYTQAQVLPQDLTWQFPAVEHWGMCPGGGAQPGPGHHLEECQRQHVPPNSENKKNSPLNRRITYAEKVVRNECN